MTYKIDIQDRLINGQMGVKKYFEIVDSAVSTIFKELDDPEADRKLIGAKRLARQNNWVPVKRTDTNIFVGNSCNSLLIQGTVSVEVVMGMYNARSTSTYFISSSCQLQFRKTDLQTRTDVCCFEQNYKLAGIVFDRHILQGSHKS